RFVTFTSAASNLTTGPAGKEAQIYLRDVSAARTTTVSVAANGGGANARSFLSSISGDGTTVTFISNANNLAAGDHDHREDAYVRIVLIGTTVWASSTGSGGSLNAPIFMTIGASPDNRFVSFSAITSAIVPDPTGVELLFLRDAQTL